jgi:hypothetical protein
MPSEGTFLRAACLLLVVGCGDATSGMEKQTRSGPGAPNSQGMPASTAGAGAPAASSDSPVLPSAGSSSPLVTVSQVQPDDCRAGHYIGSFLGDYHSGAWFGGEETIMFSTSDVGDKPGFEFWLEKVDTPCRPGAEFCADAVVKGGKLRGNATPFTDPNDPNSEGGIGFSVRFEIELTGELDCRHAMLRGKLENGCYDILSVLYRFDGTIEGDYSLATSAFTKGDWDVAEMMMPNTNPPTMPLGGSGMWTAEHKDDSAAPTSGDVGLCAGQSGLDTP